MFKGKKVKFQKALLYDNFPSKLGIIRITPNRRELSLRESLGQQQLKKEEGKYIITNEIKKMLEKKEI